MTQTIAIVVNTALGLGLIGALALVVRSAHRPPRSPRGETLHPSKPLEAAVVHVQDEEVELAQAA